MDLYSPAMEPIVFASESPSKKDHIFTVLVITYNPRSMPIDFGNVGKIRSVSRSRAAEDKPFSEVAPVGDRETRYSSGRGGSGRKFCHADTDKEDSDTCDGPAPDHCCRPAIWKGIDKDGCYGRQESYDAEGDSEDLEGSKLSPKLLLVAQTGEESFVCLAVLVLHGGGRGKRTILRAARYTYGPGFKSIYYVHFYSHRSREQRQCGSDRDLRLSHVGVERVYAQTTSYVIYPLNLSPFSLVPLPQACREIFC